MDEGHTEPAGRTDQIDRAAAVATAELLSRLRRATVGEYDIHSEIARGGMASVYLAHDLALDRKVAIKLMSPAMVFGPGMVDRFRREARTAGSLSHPNIIPVYTVREADGLCFFVMKLVEGTTLDGIIRQLGKTPIAMVEAVLTQAGNALGYAHRRGVTHRDVKPGNILIDNEGWVVVTDFGIAKIADAEGLTLTGSAVGTPAYMSPEQCVGGDIGPASDQYSLGVIAFEMLTGQRPFLSPTSLAMMYAHANTEPPPLTQLRPDCPERLRLAVQRMLAKDPAARWSSMEEAVKAIGGPASGGDETTRGQLGELARTGTVANLVARAQTPRSPIPVTRRQETAKLAGGGASLWRRRLLPAFAVILLAAVAVQASLLLRGRRGEPPAPPALVAPTATPTATAPPQTVVATPIVPPAPAVQRPPRPEARPSTSVATQPPVAQPVPPPPTAPDSVPARQPSPRIDTVLPKVAIVSQQSAALTTDVPPAAVDPRRDIEATIDRYREALESGDIGRVQRAYPGLTAEQRDGLTAFFSSGGVLRSSWTVREVTVTGDKATAIVTGTNRATSSRSRPSDQAVNLRMVLERQGATWRLARVTN